MQSVERKQTKLTKKHIASLIFLSFMFIILVGIYIFINNVVNTIRPPEIPPLPTFRPPTFSPSPNNSHGDDNEDDWISDVMLAAPERFTDDDRRDMFWTFLIIGLNEGTNANTVMVASYCGVSREANMISIPRDVPVNANRRGRKLSSSYLAGAANNRGRAGGVAQVQRDVMGVIGFIPDFYVVVDYDAFFSIIDAVGGIEIYVPMRMRYDDPCQNLHIDIHPGLQMMDSQTALHFSRFRMANRGYQSITDFQRAENQQAVVNAVISSLLRPASLLRIPDFAAIFNESVHTNLTLGNITWFALELNNIRGTEAMSSYTLMPVHSSGRPMYYEFLSPSNVVEIINRTVNPFYQDIELRDVSIITQ